MAAAAVAAIASTGSRAGTLAFVVSLIMLTSTRMIAWSHLLVAALMLSMAIFWQPYAHRFGPDQLDAGMIERCQLWRGVCALVADHPWSGAGSAGFMPLLDTWYLSPRLEHRFGTALNEPLTIAGRWGLAALTLYLTALGALLVHGWACARAGRRRAAVGLSILLVHIVSGQFQGHLFVGLWYVTAAWVLGVVCILSVVRVAGTSNAWRWGALAGLVAGMLFSILVPWVGHSEWRTERIGSTLIASPRNVEVRGMIAVISPAGAPRRAWRAWREARSQEHMAVAVIDEPVTIAPWMQLAKRSPTPVIAIAHGDASGAAWEAWRNGALGPASLYVSDPEHIPTRYVSNLPSTTLRVRTARAAPFVDLEKVIQKLADDGLSPPEITSGSTAAWWVVWP